jgi:hypothetical protein
MILFNIKLTWTKLFHLNAFYKNFSNKKYTETADITYM